jgi:hypothetical protein
MKIRLDKWLKREFDPPPSNSHDAGARRDPLLGSMEASA